MQLGLGVHATMRHGCSVGLHASSPCSTNHISPPPKKKQKPFPLVQQDTFFSRIRVPTEDFIKGVSKMTHFALKVGGLPGAGLFPASVCAHGCNTASATHCSQARSPL